MKVYHSLRYVLFWLLTQSQLILLSSLYKVIVMNDKMKVAIMEIV
jgi:hypothetical protein